MTDTELFTAFESASLPAEAWTHRSHVRIAALFTDRLPLDDAHILMRVGIIRLNAFHGLTETPTRGYHETITRAWLTLVASARQGRARLPTDEFFAAVPELLNKEHLARHYSKERLCSPLARAVYIEPDLLPLPAVKAHHVA
jgi:hypothetical protein